MRLLLADTALTAVLRAVLAIFAVLAGMTRVCTCACRGEDIERNLIQEKDRQNDLRKDDNQS